jgi:hypothetical protein
MKFLGIRTYYEGKDHHIEILKSEGLTALDILHLLDDLTQKLAVLYKLPAQYITGMLHAGAGGDMIEQPEGEEMKSINKLLEEIQEELTNAAEELHEQI